MIFYGRNVLLESLNSSFYVPSKIFIQADINEDAKIQKILDLKRQKNIVTEYLTRAELTKIAKSDEHQGIVFETNYVFPKLKNILNSLVKKEHTSLIYISAATYEHNIGAIIRSAEVGGINAVIVPNTIELTPTIARTSAGALFHIPLIKESIFNAIKLCKEFNYFIMAIEREGVVYSQVDKTANTLFIIGGEDKSISDPVRKKCDEILEIPQAGKVNSLNMSVAASIVIFDRLRQLNHTQTTGYIS